MRTFSLVALMGSCLSVVGLAPARADVPAFVDGPVFASLCKSVGESLGCAACSCEAMSSTPSIGVTREASSILHGILVELRGPSDDGAVDIHSVHVFLGDEEKLVAGGMVASQSAAKSEARSGKWELVKSQQAYVMCPGSCDWDAVGQVHLFEIRETWRERTPSEDGLEYDAKRLVACFERDKKPGCWQVELAMETQSWTTPEGGGKAKRGKKETRKRTWSLGGKMRYQLVLSRYTGNGVADFAFRSGYETKKKTMHFAELATWGEATAITPAEVPAPK